MQRYDALKTALEYIKSQSEITASDIGSLTLQNKRP